MYIAINIPHPDLKGVTHTNSYSDKTWYYNHASQEFQPGPNLLDGRSYPTSGSVTDHETKEKIAIIAGGYNRNGDYLDSIEILLNGEWKTGKTHTESYSCQFLYTFSLFKSNYKVLHFLGIRTSSTKGT